MASIHQVILDGRLSQLTLLVNRIGCNVNEKDSYGRTPLHLAVLSDQENYGYRVARLLLQGNTDINCIDSQRQTPLVYACLLNRSKLITLFLRIRSIDWYLADHQSYLVLHHAASSSETSILKDIIQQMKSIGLSIDCKTELGYTPLILAIKSLRFDNAMYILDHTDASPMAIDDEYHFTCQQWAQTVGPKLNEWTYYNHRRNSTIKRNRSVYKK
jgi:ankyrin repeat protein